MFKGLIYYFKSPSNKFYIGQTMQTLKRRREEHKSRAKHGNKALFYKAIRKYGIDAFEFGELATVSAFSKKELRQKLNILEIRYIADFKKEGILLYNLSAGGENVYDNTGRKLTEEHKRKIGEKLKGTIFSEERKKNISISKYKAVIQLTKSGEFIKEWPCIKDAAQFLSCNQNCISACVTGANKTGKGYKWIYKNEYISSNQAATTI